jgi:hypothetical protein
MYDGSCTAEINISHYKEGKIYRGMGFYKVTFFTMNNILIIALNQNF